MALQYLGYSFVTDIWQLIGLTIFGSIGFHLWAPLQRELNLSQVRQGELGPRARLHGRRRLGRRAYWHGLRVALRADARLPDDVPLGGVSA